MPSQRPIFVGGGGGVRGGRWRLGTRRRMVRFRFCERFDGSLSRGPQAISTVVFLWWAAPCTQVAHFVFSATQNSRGPVSHRWLVNPCHVCVAGEETSPAHYQYYSRENDGRPPYLGQLPVACVKENPPMMVALFIDNTTVTWKSEMLDEFFLPMDAEVIRSIPLSIRRMSDFWADRKSVV